MVTVAFGIAAPFASLTAPEMRPKIVWPGTLRAPEINKKTSAAALVVVNTHGPELIVFFMLVTSNERFEM